VRQGDVSSFFFSLFFLKILCLKDVYAHKNPHTGDIMGRPTFVVDDVDNHHYVKYRNMEKEQKTKSSQRYYTIQCARTSGDEIFDRCFDINQTAKRRCHVCHFGTVIREKVVDSEISTKTSSTKSERLKREFRSLNERVANFFGEAMTCHRFMWGDTQQEHGGIIVKLGMGAAGR
jgi:hypothetical protein